MAHNTRFIQCTYFVNFLTSDFGTVDSVNRAQARSTFTSCTLNFNKGTLARVILLKFATPGIVSSKSQRCTKKSTMPEKKENVRRDEHFILKVKNEKCIPPYFHRNT